MPASRPAKSMWAKVIFWSVNMPILRATLAALLVIPIVLATSSHATEAKSASCESYRARTPPKFRVADHIRNENKRSTILFISVSPHEQTLDELLTLGCSLGRDYAHNQIFTVFIFDDFRTAKRYNPQGEGNDSKMARSFLASYGFSREDDYQTLTWFREPGNNSSLVEINLGPTPPMPSP